MDPLCILFKTSFIFCVSSKENDEEENEPDSSKRYGRLIDKELEVLSNVEDLLQQRSLRSFFYKYHPSEEIYEYLNHLKCIYSSLMEIEEVGTTYNNKALKLVKLRTESNINKPIIWIDGGIHAREWITSATAIYFIYKLLTGFEDDLDITNLLRIYDWYIMPVVNPDGYDYSFEEERQWRKNRSKSSIHSNGVDLNRNFGYEWNNNLLPKEARNPNSDNYIGPYPMSEKETQAIAWSLIKVYKRVKLFISLHSYGQYILFPWGCKKEHVKEYHHLKRVSRHAAEKITSFIGTKYKTGSICNAKYPAPGNSIDWTYGELGIKYSFVFELRDRGKQKFELNQKEIIPVGEETWRGVRSIISDIEKDSFLCRII